MQTRLKQSQNSNVPTISVGMPVYNGERYLAEAIDSVLAQTHEDFELIVADNASTDNTASICREYASRDPRIIYLRNQRNIGAAKNYNLTFNEARAPYFRWHNADDKIEPDLHARCLELLEQDDKVVLASGTTCFIDENGFQYDVYRDDLCLMDDKPVERFREFFQRVGLTNVIYGLMRSSAMRKTPLFGAGNIPAADIRFMAILVLQGKFSVFDQPLFYRRMHQESSSADRSDVKKQSTFWSGSPDGFQLPQWKIQFSYWRAVSNLNVTLSEKLALYRYLMTVLYARKRKLVQEIASFKPLASSK